MIDSIRRAGIIGIGSAIPDQVLDNAYFEKIVDTNDE
jgi:3-oxoacyl-[acyl-carrier-protein] synthase III